MITTSTRMVLNSSLVELNLNKLFGKGKNTKKKRNVLLVFIC